MRFLILFLGVVGTFGSNACNKNIATINSDCPEDGWIEAFKTTPTGYDLWSINITRPECLMSPFADEFMRTKNIRSGFYFLSKTPDSVQTYVAARSKLGSFETDTLDAMVPLDIQNIPFSQESESVLIPHDDGIEFGWSTYLHSFVCVSVQVLFDTLTNGGFDIDMAVANECRMVARLREAWTFSYVSGLFDHASLNPQNDELDGTFWGWLNEQDGIDSNAYVTNCFHTTTLIETNSSLIGSEVIFDVSLHVQSAENSLTTSTTVAPDQQNFNKDAFTNDDLDQLVASTSYCYFGPHQWNERPCIRDDHIEATDASPPLLFVGRPFNITLGLDDVLIRGTDIVQVEVDVECPKCPDWDTITVSDTSFTNDLNTDGSSGCQSTANNSCEHSITIATSDFASVQSDRLLECLLKEEEACVHIELRITFANQAQRRLTFQPPTRRRLNTNAPLEFVTRTILPSNMSEYYVLGDVLPNPNATCETAGCDAFLDPICGNADCEPFHLPNGSKAIEVLSPLPLAFPYSPLSRDTKLTTTIQDIAIQDPCNVILGMISKGSIGQVHTCDVRPDKHDERLTHIDATFVGWIQPIEIENRLRTVATNVRILPSYVRPDEEVDRVSTETILAISLACVVVALAIGFGVAFNRRSDRSSRNASTVRTRPGNSWKLLKT